jgi:Flp pilus assembly protein TadG
MRPTHKATGRRYEHGAVAVEAAIVLPLLLLVLGFPSLLLAFYFRQYTAVQKAAHDAAIYLSTAPRLEMTTAGPDGTFAALTVARKIVARELAGIVPGDGSASPYFTCYYLQAGNPKGNACTPQIFKLDNNTLFQFDVAINVPFVDPLTGSEVDSLYMSTIPTVRYLGN